MEGSHLVSIKEVAAHAGALVGTVSNVLNRPANVDDDTLRRVRTSIAELGYVRNELARQLRAGPSRGGPAGADGGSPAGQGSA